MNTSIEPKQNIRMAGKMTLAAAMQEAGAKSLTAYFRGPRMKDLHICPTCKGAGLHKLGCEAFQSLEVMPRALARKFGSGRLGRQAWTGFADAASGVVL